MNFEAPEVGGVRPVAAAPVASPDVLPSVDYYARQPFIKSLQESVMAKGELPQNLRELEQNRLNLLKNGQLSTEEYMNSVMDAAAKDGLTADEIWQASGKQPPIATVTAPATSAATVAPEPAPVSVNYLQMEPAPARVEVNPVQSVEAKPGPAQVENPTAKVEVKPAKGQPAQLPQVDYGDRAAYYQSLKDALVQSGKKTKNLQQAISSRIGYLRNGGSESGYIEKLSQAAAKDGLKPSQIWEAAGQEAPVGLPDKLPKDSRWKQKAVLYGGVGGGVAGLGGGATLYRQLQGQPGFTHPQSTVPATSPTTTAPGSSTPSRPTTTTSAKVSPVTLPQPTKAAPYQAQTQPSYPQQKATYQKLQQEAQAASAAVGYYLDKGDLQKAGEVLNHPNYGTLIFGPNQFLRRNPGFTTRYQQEPKSNPVTVAQSNQPDIETIREMLRRPAGAVAFRPASRPTPVTATPRLGGPLPLPSALDWLRMNSEPGQGRGFVPVYRRR